MLQVLQNSLTSLGTTTSEVPALQVAFMPHGMCYLWKPELVSLHIISDSLIAVAYYSIPAMLIYFVRNRQDIPFSWVFWLFGAFIVACGTNHLLEVWTLWHPNYWLSGTMKLATAMVSLYTAVELFSLIPKALALPSPAALETANEKLAEKVDEKQELIAVLTETEERFRSIFEGAAIGIALADMSGRIITANPALAQMLGYSERELIGKRFTDFTPPDEIDCTEDIYHGMVSGNQDYYQLEKRYLAKNKQMKWANLTISLVRGIHSKPQYSLSMVQDITERKQAEAELRRHREHLQELVQERTAEIAKINECLTWQATHDELTQLLNRRAFTEVLEEAVQSAKYQNLEHTLCYLDLDRFKAVNDTCGHHAGDALLCEITRLFQSCCRKTDSVARLGGDEFAILLHQCSLEQGEKLAQTILRKVQEFCFRWEDQTFSIGVSIGLVGIDAESPHSEAVLVAADSACYEAKRGGRNQVYVDLEIMQIDHWELESSGWKLKD